MAKPDRGFLIGALLMIPNHNLSKQVTDSYADAGFSDLTPAHSAVFRFLSREGDRITDLAERAHMTKQSMGYLVKQLEANGYVERIPDPSDGRAQLVRRTERGWAVNRFARQKVQEIQDEWTELLGEEKMQQLLENLADLVKLLGVEFAGSTADVDDN